MAKPLLKYDNLSIFFQNGGRPLGPSWICLVHVSTTNDERWYLPLSKNWLDRRSSFVNMQMLMFVEFGLKMPIHAPKFFGGLPAT